MKRFLTLILFVIFFGFIGCDKDISFSEVPSVVENTFKSNFPDAKDVEWKTVGEDYQVSFELEDVDYHALLNNLGNLLKYRYEIEENELPESIKKSLRKEYTKKDWDDPEYIIEGESTYYQLEIESFFRDKKLVVDNSGKLEENKKYWN